MALRPRTVRARLTLWYTIVLAVPLIGFALASYFIFARTLINRTDSFIRDGLQGLFGSRYPNIDRVLEALGR